MRKYENNIVAQWRFRDFFSMVQALLAVADGDIEYAQKVAKDVNKAHALNMAKLKDRVFDCGYGRKPADTALAPLEILDVFTGPGGDLHIRHSIPGSGDTGQFPASAIPG